ncbi:MAG: BMP family ABC transporter substrate-binding protein, partial [Anaerolineae bacterium]|nr:BMP family ABC transporter substrate-binding protein [Anaerolineae bacterium]
MFKQVLSLMSVAVVIMILAACGGQDAATGGEGAAPEELKLAAIFPGTITDADYNTLGHIGITTVNEELGAEIAFSETVAVPDVDRVMREYIDDGFNIVFTHGGQFLNQTIELAKEFPDVYFIAEADAEIADAPDNVWVIVRNMEVGAYGGGA